MHYVYFPACQYRCYTCMCSFTKKGRSYLVLPATKLRGKRQTATGTTLRTCYIMLNIRPIQRLSTKKHKKNYGISWYLPAGLSVSIQSPRLGSQAPHSTKSWKNVAGRHPAITSWYGNYPSICMVLAPSKRWLALGFLVVAIKPVCCEKNTPQSLMQKPWKLWIPQESRHVSGEVTWCVQ